ncbi:hypothetical protein DPMN_123893 [Dreissena polymorpha]|uniref:NR LBD domain-containing protein n=1 Tax=Dreissena polymorpha TaxID=45954 RepID=A0A9D4JVM7_DREPO|nr:hypothetical protein DPMN_123893 [Dreissena polymorpha]
MAPTHNVNSPSGEISERAFEIIQSIRAERGLERDTMCDKSAKPCRTLQSVLRGEVPSAYMHLAVPANECYYQNAAGILSVVRKGHRTAAGYKPYPCASPNRHIMHNTSLAGRSVDDFRDPSPQRVHPYPEQLLLTPDSVYGQGSTSCQDSDLYAERDSPVMESRFCTFQESVSPFLDYSASSPYHHVASSPAHSGYGSGRESSSSYHGFLRHSVSPYSPYQRTPSPHSSNSSPFNGSQTADIEFTPVKYSFDSRQDDADTDNDQPMDLSKKSPKQNPRSASNCIIDADIDPTDKHELNSGSLLRNLLTNSHEQRRVAQDASSGRSTPDSDVYKPDIQISGCTPVTLAKKMVYPITSRVSDWLLKIVQFAKTIPEFASMSQNDKWTLLVHAWARMLLLLMAENELEFAVTPLTSGGAPGVRDSRLMQPSQCKDEPTMKSVEGVQNFIRKCKNMSLDQKEYALLRMAVLFNTGMYNSWTILVSRSVITGHNACA